MDILLPLLTLVIGLLAGGLLVLLRLRGQTDPGIAAALTARGEDQAVIRDGLDRLHDQLRDLDTQRVSWQSQLRQHVDDVRHSTDLLRQETSGLTTALRKPQVRGQWGEMHLRRTVELAGLVNRCDFTEQVNGEHDGRRLRPDLVVNLPGGRSIVVDSKVPLDAFLDAVGASDPDEHEHHLQRHARQVRTHIDALASKSYWRTVTDSPEFVVLFLPAESFLSAALESDPGLLEHAATRQVVLATPTSLIGLLRTVAHGWTQQALAEQTREVHELGRTLHERIAKVGDHLTRLGRSLTNSVEAYNAAVGSLESRVLVTARQFQDLSVTRDSLPSPRPVESSVRPLTAAELLDAATPQRADLADQSGEPPAPSDRAV